MKDAVIQVNNLQKSFKATEVLKGVDLEVMGVEIFALLGSNGAGKTTTVNILSTLLEADRGSASVCGFDVAQLALTWVAVIPGLSAKTPDGASAFSYPLVFLPFLSSAFVPTETMPTALGVFAQNQPVTSIVDTVRALLASEPVGNDIWIALAWCVAIAALAYILAMRTYRKIA